MIDGERDVARREVGDRAQRYHGLGVGAHGRAGRCRALAGIADRVEREIAGGVGRRRDGGGVAVAADVFGPLTVPATALVAWVPPTVPPAVLTKMSLRVSGFCQYCGATSMTT